MEVGEACETEATERLWDETECEDSGGVVVFDRRDQFEELHLLGIGNQLEDVKREL